MCIVKLDIPLKSHFFLYHFAMITGLFLVFQFDHISDDSLIPFAHVFGVCFLFFGFIFFVWEFFKFAKSVSYLRWVIKIEKYVFFCNVLCLFLFFICFIFSFSNVFFKVAIAAEYILFCVVLIQLFLLNLAYYEFSIQLF